MATDLPVGLSESVRRHLRCSLDITASMQGVVRSLPLQQQAFPDEQSTLVHC